MIINEYEKFNFCNWKTTILIIAAVVVVIIMTKINRERERETNGGTSNIDLYC